MLKVKTIYVYSCNNHEVVKIKPKCLASCTRGSLIIAQKKKELINKDKK